MRIISAVAAAVLATGAAYAGPHKMDRQVAQSEKRTAPAVLASAEAPKATPSDVSQPEPAPAKRRVGRVTNCRCGDPQPDSQSPDR